MHLLDKFKYCPQCSSAKFVDNNSQSKKCLDCGFVYYLNAIAAVAGFIVDSKGRLLLCQRAKEPAKGKWDLPGGFVDVGESAEEAIVREIKEELSLNVKQLRYLFSIPNNYPFSNFVVRTLDMFFEIKVDDFSNIESKDDVGDWRLEYPENINIEDIGLDSIKKAVKSFKDNRNLK